jgi:hypothetical protein
MARPTPEKLALLRKMLRERGVQASAPAGEIPRREESGDAPLSGGQERMWFLDRYEPGSSLYNDALALTVRGVELDPELFRRALQEVVRRHEVLRTSFHTGPSGPVQRVHAAEEARLGEELPFRVIDLSGAGGRAELDALLLADVQGPFELDRLPLLRALLARLGEDEWVFGLAMHHIVSDGVSYDVIYRELGALLRALAEDRPSPLPELSIQFTDFAAWERARVTEDVIAELLPFWKRYLGGELPALAWPTEGRTGTPEHRGHYHRFHVPDAAYSALTTFCREEQVTSNWVLMAVYFVLLHTLDGQLDLRIGTPSSTRKHGELEALVGFFVQTVILRIDLSGNPSFREVLSRTRETALEVAKHEDVPFDRVVQAVRPGRSSEETPLIQAWIAPMKDLMAPLELPGATSSYEIVDGQIARFDLALILDEARGGISAFFEYDTALFTEEVVAGLAERTMKILRQAVDHPDTRLDLFRELALAPAEPGRRRGPRTMKKVRRRTVDGDRS